MSQQVILWAPSQTSIGQCQSSIILYPIIVCILGTLVILTVQTGPGVKGEKNFPVLRHLRWKWIHKKLQTRTQHGSFSQRSIPEIHPGDSSFWVLEPQGRNPQAHSCCTAQHEAGTLDVPRCCSQTETNVPYVCVNGQTGVSKKVTCEGTYNMMLSSKHMSVKVLSTITRSVS